MIYAPLRGRRPPPLTCTDPLPARHGNPRKWRPRPGVSAIAPAGMRSVTVCLAGVLVTANTGESP
jgi:hypothetical protein